MSKININKRMKTYYGNDRLNRGHKVETEIKNYAEKTAEENISLKYEYLLPPIEVLSGYEEIFPGTLERILNMAKKEQELKYELEKCSLLVAEKVKKLGIIFAFLIICVICTSAACIAYTDLKTALIFSLIAFSAVFGVSLLSKFSSGRNFRYNNRNKTYYQNNQDGKSRYNNRNK